MKLSATSPRFVQSDHPSRFPYGFESKRRVQVFSHVHRRGLYQEQIIGFRFRKSIPKHVNGTKRSFARASSFFCFCSSWWLRLVWIDRSVVDRIAVPLDRKKRDGNASNETWESLVSIRIFSWSFGKQERGTKEAQPIDRIGSFLVEPWKRETNPKPSKG